MTSVNLLIVISDDLRRFPPKQNKKNQATTPSTIVVLCFFIFSSLYLKNDQKIHVTKGIFGRTFSFIFQQKLADLQDLQGGAQVGGRDLRGADAKWSQRWCFWYAEFPKIEPLASSTALELFSATEWS